MVTVGTVLTGLTDAGEGLDQAADGAQQLADGLGAANDGAQRLADGAHALSTGLDTASAGSAQLAAGTEQLAASVDTATGPLLMVLDRVGALNLDPTDVALAAQHLSGAVRSTTERIAALNVNSAQAAAIVDQAVAFLQTNPDPAVRDAGHALAGAQRLLRAQGIDPTTDEGLTRLRDSAARLEHELGDPNSSLRVFLAKALDGGLRADVARLHDGVDELNTGAQRLKEVLAQGKDLRKEDPPAAWSLLSQALRDAADEVTKELVRDALIEVGRFPSATPSEGEERVVAQRIRAEQVRVREEILAFIQDAGGI